MRQKALEAQVGSCARACVDAHLGHHAGDDKPGDLMPAQMFEQRCVTEAVREILPQHRFAGMRRHAFVYLNSRRIRQEEARARPRRDVLDVNDRQGFLPECVEQLPGPGAGLRAADQFHGSAGEVVILNVDEQQCRSHGKPLTWVCPALRGFIARRPVTEGNGFDRRVMRRFQAEPPSRETQARLDGTCGRGQIRAPTSVQRQRPVGPWLTHSVSTYAGHEPFSLWQKPHRPYGAEY